MCGKAFTTAIRKPQMARIPPATANNLTAIGTVSLTKNMYIEPNSIFSQRVIIS